MLEIVPSNQFRKDLKLARKRGLKIERLKEVVNILAEQKKLEDKYRDHGLSGQVSGPWTVWRIQGIQRMSYRTRLAARLPNR